MPADENGELPRLPPAVQPPVGEQPTLPFGAADLGGSHRTDEAVRQVRWVDYVEPELLTLRRARLSLVGARVALALWASALVVAASLVRFDVGAGSRSTTSVWVVASVGSLVVGSLAVVGWWWSDTATQNIHRLDGRRPTRRRCTSAWASPLVWFVVLSFTVLRLDPTEVVDVRPAISAVIFASALWRPYALVRRILKSLIRVDSDLVVASGYLLDLACFGLLWARLADLPDEIGPADTGIADTLIGLGAVAAVAAFGNIVVWHLLTRDVDRATSHRAVAVRTRHDHRQLRLAGIDPLDPKVLLAMHAIRQEAHRARVDGLDPDGDARGAVDGQPDDARSDSTGSEQAATVDTAAATAAVRHARVEAEPSLDESVEVEAVSETSDVVTPDDQSRLDTAWSAEAGLADGVSRSDAQTPEQAPPVEQPKDAARVNLLHDVRRRFGEAAAVSDAEPLEPTGGDSNASSSQEGAAGEETDAPVDRLAARRARFDREGTTDRIERLSRRFDGEAELIDPAPASDRIDRLSKRLDSEAAAGEPKSVLDRLERLGIEAGGAALPDDGTGWHADDSRTEVALVRGRVYSLELARYLLILATALSACASVWFVVASFDVRELTDGTIAVPELARLETARLWSTRALAVVLAFVPVWCAVAAWWANRVGADVRGAFRCAALAAVSGILVGVGFASSSASDGSMYAVFGVLGAALWSSPVMLDLARAFGYGTTIPALLPAALGAGVVAAWAGGLLQPLAETDSVATMSFFGGLAALAAALAAVVAVVSTGDVVEVVKLTPDVPDGSRRSAVEVSEDELSHRPGS